MSDVYRLVFRGEVLKGQHPAVVRRRLARAADFDDAALDKLFSGKPVVVRREADTATAARLQVMFKNAGARLRVLPVEGQEHGVRERVPDPAGSARDVPAGRSTAEPAPAPPAFVLLPPASDILRPDERVQSAPCEIDTRGLELATTAFHRRHEKPSAVAPAVPPFTVANAGATLAPPRAQPEAPVRAPDFELARVGADLGPKATSSPVPVVGEVDFELAPVGTTLDQHPATDAPAAPDISHLKLADEER